LIREPAKDPPNAKVSSNKPFKIEFVVDYHTAQSILKAERVMYELIRNSDLQSFTFDEFGAKWVKENGID
jgi:hypothetical protein